MIKKHLIFWVLLFSALSVAGCGQVFSLKNTNRVTRSGVTSSDYQACVASQLTLASSFPQGMTGNELQEFTLTNHGTTGCTLSGYPSLSLTYSGGALHILTTQGTIGQTIPVTMVVLASGKKAFFEASYPIVTTSGLGNCPIATQIGVTLPQGGTVTLASIRIPDCSGAIGVSPFYGAVPKTATPTP